MAITIHKPNDPVTGFSLSAIAGSLPADTYKVRLEVVGTATASTQHIGAQQRSAPSSEQTIVLGAVGGIRLNWTNPTDGLNKNTIIFIYSQTLNRWYYYLGVGYTGLDPALTTYDLIVWTVTQNCGTNWLKGSTSPNPAFPCGLNAEIGQGMIEINGAAGDITPSDLISALKTSYGGSLPANAYYNDFKTFWGCWSIKSTGATSGSLNLYAWELWMFGGIENSDDFNIFCSSNRIQQTILYSPAQQGSCCYYSFGKCDLNCASFGGGTYGMDSTYYGHVQMCTTSLSKFTDSIISGSFPSIYYHDTFDNCNFICNQMILRNPTITAPVLKTTLLGSGCVRFSYSEGNNMVQLLNWQIDRGSYQVDLRSDRSGYTSAILKFIDPYFPNTKSGYDYIPVIYWRCYGREPNPVEIQSEVDIKVIDHKNNSIAGATVVLKNKAGVEMINTTTDANGVISKAYVTHHTVSHIIGSGDGYVGTNQINDYNPFTLTIKKKGYVTLETDFTLNKKTDEIITLKHIPLIAIIDNLEMLPFIV